MKCKKCGAEIKEGSKFCSECGEKIGEEQSKVDKKNIFSDKKNIVIIVLCLVIVSFAGFMLYQNIGTGNKNFDGTYSNLNDYAPLQVTVKDGVIGVTYDGNSYSGEYKYDEATNTISSERESKEDGVKFTLRTVDGNYYLGIDQVDDYYDFGYSEEVQIFKEGTKERKDVEQQISDNKTAEEEEEQKAKDESSKFNGTTLSGSQYIVIGESLEPGIYSFAPVPGDDYYSVYVYENKSAYDEDDYLNMYYGSDVEEGISLTSGMVIDIGSEGVQYKKQ